MLSGTAAISASGIVPSHVTAFIAVARAADSIILVRGVNPDSTALIEENYATKNLHVKGKSADWGPQAGFICEDQELGKGEGNIAEIQRLNGEIAKSFSHAFSLPVPLILSEARLQDLRDKGMITLNSNPGSTAGVFKITAANAGDPRNQPRSQNFVFYATPYHYFLRENPLGMACYQKAVSAVFGLNPKLGNGSNAYVICYSKGPMGGGKWRTSWKLLRVVANTQGLPLTADYDLYAVCPRLRLSPYYHQKLDAAMALPDPRAKLSGAIRAVGKALTSDLIGHRPEHEDMGRISARLEDMKNKLNLAAQSAGYQGGNVIHHGVEVDNLKYTEKLNTVTIITPGGKIYVANQGGQNRGELEDVVRDMMKLGYVFYTNRSYNQGENPQFNVGFDIGTYTLKHLTPQDAI